MVAVRRYTDAELKVLARLLAVALALRDSEDAETTLFGGATTFMGGGATSRSRNDKQRTRSRSWAGTLLTRDPTTTDLDGDIGLAAPPPTMMDNDNDENGDGDDEDATSVAASLADPPSSGVGGLLLFRLTSPPPTHHHRDGDAVPGRAHVPTPTATAAIAPDDRARVARERAGPVCDLSVGAVARASPTTTTAASGAASAIHDHQCYCRQYLQRGNGIDGGSVCARYTFAPLGTRVPAAGHVVVVAVLASTTAFRHFFPSVPGAANAGTGQGTGRSDDGVCGLGDGSDACSARTLPLAAVAGTCARRRSRLGRACRPVH
ncbi:hypothetical protein BC828DRAFT_397388 [Blastocladiella britannica]|nr:hypothetical protein BC828DRAFT_397388 [Blastocladiella britannica]